MLLFGLKSSMTSGHMLIMTTSHTDATSHDDSAVWAKVMYDIRAD